VKAHTEHTICVVDEPAEHLDGLRFWDGVAREQVLKEGKLVQVLDLGLSGRSRFDRSWGCC
jgi:hypothetical protein